MPGLVPGIDAFAPLGSASPARRSTTSSYEKQPVTAAMALRLGKFFGKGPEFWLDLQRDYDLRTLEPRMRGDLAAIEPVAA